jgi:hypothetical protein
MYSELDERLRFPVNYATSATPATSSPQVTGLPVRIYARLSGTRHFETACNLFSTAVFLLLGNAVYQAWIFYLARLRSSGGYS